MCIRDRFYGGDGRVLKVRYKGQRGEGVYDLVWNGLVDLSLIHI